MATVLWLAFMAWSLISRPDATGAMKPNEWGDFFAGYFAPLAFLWLVLGYLQQGDELKLSTEALRLQADELRNSVDQQRELVEVTRQQVENDREALRIQVAQHLDSLAPKFVLQPATATFQGDGRSIFEFAIRNVGNSARNVDVAFSGPDGLSVSALQVPIFGPGEQRGFRLDLPGRLPEGKILLTTSYQDNEGRMGQVQHLVLPTSSGPNSTVRLERIDA